MTLNLRTRKRIIALVDVNELNELIDEDEDEMSRKPRG